VTGLSPNTTYHFRIFATNAGGEMRSVDETFKTLVIPPPTVTSINPTEGPAAGGTLVTIKGSGFVAGASVTVGTVVEVVSETEIKATTAAGTGSRVVAVTDANGTSTGGPLYTYVIPPCAAAPAITEQPKDATVTAPATASFKAAGSTPVNCAAPTVQWSSEAPGAGSFSPIAGATSDTYTTPATSTTESGTRFRAVFTNAFAATTTDEVTLTVNAAPVPESQPSTDSAGTVVAETAKSGVLGSTTAAPPPPKFGVSGNVAPVSGTVLVRLPGTSIFVPLTTIRQIPFGTIINATNGRVTVTTRAPNGAIQTITYSQGEFKLTQDRNGFVVATLVGGSFAGCPTAAERSHIARASAAKAKSKHVVRKLWSEGHGRYSTKGNYAAGAVLGTRWLTEDLCEGTLIRVVTDRVAVTNLVNHHHLTVKAGHSYLAKAP
jgi:IPT/TIG domain-containing protein